MFNLIRRISHGVIPRPDRPWEDDPTSNAPAKRKKRRMSSSERGEDAGGSDSFKKKMRGDSIASDATDNVQENTSPSSDSKAVKEVTKGVKEVELADTAAADPVVPEAVPLPEEKSGELDEPGSENTPPAENEAADDISDDNASSVNEEPSEHLVNGRSSNASSEAPEQAPEAAVADEKVDTTNAKTMEKDKRESSPEPTHVDPSSAT